MTSHAPYLMPDGSRLSSALCLRAESVQGVSQTHRRKKRGSGKQDQWNQLIEQAQRLRVSGADPTSSEASELRALVSVGLRRRRRWLNEKNLRDLAGPLTANDMQDQFSPPPFGATPVISPLAMITQPGSQAMALWSHFTNVDMDKEQRVLQKWEDYNRTLSHESEAGPSGQAPSGRGGASASSDPAVAALRSWARVSPKARQALRKANLHAVLQLEMQVLDFVEQTALLAAAPGGCDERRPVGPVSDGFARLLVHGLAEFHGLLSCSKPNGSGGTDVLIYRPRSKAPAASASSNPSPPAAASSPSPSAATATATAASSSSGGGGSEAAAAPAGAGAEPGTYSAAAASVAAPAATAAAAATVTAPAHPDITCTDVLLALGELGAGGLTHNGLRQYVKRHIHGADTSSEDWVVV